MLKKISKLTALGLFFLLTSPALAQNMELNRYEQAKINLNYQGELGDFLQKLAGRLNIGFISYNVDSTRPIQLDTHNQSQPLPLLIQQIQQQLPEVNIRFETLGNRVFLVLSSGDEPLQREQQPQQYIGQVIFERPTPPANRLEVEILAQTEETGQKPTAHNETEKPQPQDNQAEERESLQTQHTETEEKPEEKPDEKIDHSTQEQANLTPIILSPEQEQRIAQISRLEQLINEANLSNEDKQYQHRVIPSYKINSKNRLGLDKVQTTKIATFLLFDKQTDTSKLNVRSKHEDIIQLDNILAIIHKKNRAPNQISIQNDKKQSLILQAVKR
ncbi:hypothetical protein [Volucribacter amazonae]|uniref:Uncharacterized protein n=1 Tax=Volucribacter amazonae TaxID=256731 RepID=A0A9X4P921_9PAST|nr:hypothetical protein [Volucribacter amazonae]MDG6894753.1 hypothetical protein [Volucribacter amazonae]